MLLKIIFAGGAARLSQYVSPEGAAAVVTAGMQVIDEIGDRWGRRAVRQAADVAEEAVGESGLTLDEFADRIAGDPHLDHLAARVFETAAQVTTATQLRILSKILANATVHPESVDDELLIATALAPLERPHFRMLAVLSDEPPVGEEPTKPRVGYWNADNLRGRLGWPNPSVISTLLTLQASGLIYLTNNTRAGGATWGAIESVGKQLSASLATTLTANANRVRAVLSC